MPGVLAALGVSRRGRPARAGRRARWPACDRVAVLLVDGLGHHLLPLAAPHAPVLAAARRGRAARVVGPRPSRPASRPPPRPAWPASAPGAAPGAHGLVGFFLNVPGTDRVLNHIEWRDDPDPLRWQPLATQFDVAAAAGVTAHVVEPTRVRRQRADHGRLPGRRATSGAADVDALADADARPACAATGADGGLRLPCPTWTRPATCSASTLQSGRTAVADVDALLDRLVDGLPPRLGAGRHGRPRPAQRAGRPPVRPRRRPRPARRACGSSPASRGCATCTPSPGARDDVIAAWRGVLGDAAWVVPRDAGGGRGLVRPGGRGSTCSASATWWWPATPTTSCWPPGTTRRRWPTMVAFHGSATEVEMMIPLLSSRWRRRLSCRDRRPSLRACRARGPRRSERRRRLHGSCTSTWTRSSRRSRCAAGPSCAAGRSWSAGPGRAAWSARPATRRGRTACAVPCRARRPGGCARTRSSCRPTWPPTPRRPGRSWRSSPTSPRWSSRSRVDEAFLDVAGARAAARPTAPRSPSTIRARVAAEQRLTCSVGVASTKFMAKLASTRAKPDGLLVVPAAERAGVPAPAAGRGAVGRRRADGRGAAPARPAHGRRRGAGAGRACCARRWATAAADHLHELAWGRDPRPVSTERVEKSIGAETTFDVDVADPDVIRRTLLALADAGRRPAAAGRPRPAVRSRSRSGSPTSGRSTGRARWPRRPTWPGRSSTSPGSCTGGARSGRPDPTGRGPGRGAGRRPTARPGSRPSASGSTGGGRPSGPPTPRRPGSAGAWSDRRACSRPAPTTRHRSDIAAGGQIGRTA